MNRMARWIASVALMAVTMPFAAPAMAQSRGAFYNGARSRQVYNDRYDRHYDDHDRHDQGGIGPGKGALIGGAGGAALGALFGGGLKGALIGGAHETTE